MEDYQQIGKDKYSMIDQKFLILLLELQEEYIN